MFRPRSLLCFFLSLGATGAIFFINAISLDTYSGAALLTCSPIAIEWDKCVASSYSDIDTGYPFPFARPPSPLLFPICLLDLIPRPRGVGCAGVYLICGCGHGDDLPACFLTVPLSRYRSFATTARFALRGVLLGYPAGSVPSSLVVRPRLVRFC